MREGDFRIRGKEISRVEGLSDAVFGFAITLLAISLEVPKTSGEVLHALRGVGAFAITFLLLFNLWRAQYTFFRRYGIEDNKVVTLTGLLLFVLLIFVYPLKFIMATMTNKLLGAMGFPDAGFHRAVVLPDDDIPVLFGVFGLGLAAVFAVFNHMYRHAYSLRDSLQLDATEQFDTLEQLRVSAVLIGLGLGVGVPYLIAAAVPSARKPLEYAATALMFVSAVMVVRLRRTRTTRREASRHELAEPAR
ncbi:MAG TPA: TMEM175 family protein [Gemmatimonadaceae bacterium]|nr:TMEM175 family protein [Gemmatimonadaceae bacterium]